MPLHKHKQKFLRLLRESIFMIVGAVLIWRGIWIVLDRIDSYFFGGSHVWSSVVGIFVGIVLVYWADRDLEDVV